MDIKPQNLLLSTSEDHKRSSGGSETIRPGGRASALALPLPAIGGIVLKLGDFGIAQLLKAGERGDRLIGTPLYMAPELVVHRRYDAKVDLWAFGAVLHELLYGFPPLHPAGRYASHQHVYILHSCSDATMPDAKLQVPSSRTEEIKPYHGIHIVRPMTLMLCRVRPEH
eukprot:SAG11_NODE_1185_length_5591_cov_2.879097_3_plen_169_part_00